MEEKQTRRNTVLIAILIAALGILFILGKTDPQYFRKVPVLGSVIAGVTNPAPSANQKNPSRSETTFSVGIATGAQSVQPLNGSKLNPPGAYKDGTYTGVSSTQDGVLIIKITISKGVLANVDFLTLPKNTDMSILEQLASEAVKNQVVEVSPISGYDNISVAFTTAMSDAIKKAFNI